MERRRTNLAIGYIVPVVFCIPVGLYYRPSIRNVFSNWKSDFRCGFPDFCMTLRSLFTRSSPTTWRCVGLFPPVWILSVYTTPSGAMFITTRPIVLNGRRNSRRSFVHFLAMRDDHTWSRLTVNGSVVDNCSQLLADYRGLYYTAPIWPAGQL